jgi:hypothetical protein
VLSQTRKYFIAQRGAIRGEEEKNKGEEGERRERNKMSRNNEIIHRKAHR